MSRQYEYDDEDFEQTGGGKWIRLIGMAVYMLIIIAFAWQTFELVSWLFPAENWFMKAVTVFVCDGCATLYAMTEMFYRFRLRWSKNLIFGMWIVTFLFSTSATIVQLYLSSIDRIPHKIDPGVTTIAYGIIIFAFVVNIIAITAVIRMEYNAGQPKRLYQDDKEYKQRRRSLQPVRVVEQVSSRALVPALAASKDQVLDPHKIRPAIDAEKKNIEEKPPLTLWERLKDTINFDIPIEEETIEEEEEEEKWKPGDPLPENYIDWTDAQWKEAKDQLDTWQYEALFDQAFPDERVEKPKKKTRAKKKANLAD